MFIAEFQENTVGLWGHLSKTVKTEVSIVDVMAKI